MADTINRTQYFESVNHTKAPDWTSYDRQIRLCNGFLVGQIRGAVTLSPQTGEFVLVTDLAVRPRLTIFGVFVRNGFNSGNAGSVGTFRVGTDGNITIKASEAIDNFSFCFCIPANV